MPPRFYLADLDDLVQTRCPDPACDATPETVRTLTMACHPTTGCRVRLLADGTTVRLRCGLCRQFGLDIAVTPPAQLTPSCRHRRRAVEVVYVEGALLVTCRCGAPVAALEVQRYIPLAP